MARPLTGVGFTISASPPRGQPRTTLRSTVVNPKLARTLFFAALGLYLLWFVGLVILGVVSGDRPPERRARPASAPAVPQETKDGAPSGMIPAGHPRPSVLLSGRRPESESWRSKKLVKPNR
jgi:hypothetical protein